MDGKLSYTVSGAGSPLFLLHGNGEDRTIFKAQTAAFSAYRRVIAVDTRGHGQSPRGSAPFTLAQFARDLEGLMDDLGIPRADLLGYSDGGNVALLFALAHPERVRSVIVSGANLRPLGMKPGVWLDIAARYAFWGAVSPFFSGAARKKELYGLMAVQPHISPKKLRTLTAPVLVIAGTRDVIREGHTRRIAACLPNGRLTLLEGGHAVLQEAPEAFNRVVIGFLLESAAP